MRPPTETDVLIVGAGPVGLTLALELEQHGVRACVIERNSSSTRHPKMDVTNARSMELYRRLGIVDDLRATAISEESPTRVGWVTDAGGWELAGFTYPPVAEMRESIRTTTDGTTALEPWMRVSQVVLEPALCGVLRGRTGEESVFYGWCFESFDEDADGVTVTVSSSATGEQRTIRAAYLAGCDGAGSRVRRQLGVTEDEVKLAAECLRQNASGILRFAATNFAVNRRLPPDGRFYLVHFTTTEPEVLNRFGPMWHMQSPEGWTLISQNDADIFTIHIPLGFREDADAIDPRELVFEQLGVRFDMEVILANAWTPRLVVADSYGRGRVWLAGDSVHQFVPTGGYGMNTGVGDAVGLGGALAATVNGWAGRGLLEAYGTERRGVAVRNRRAAVRHSLVRTAAMSRYSRTLSGDGWRGELSRRRAGRTITDLGNLENHAHGIELGYRYTGSPVICAEPGASSDSDDGVDAGPLDRYLPTTAPGSRPPSVFLDDGTALFDLFGDGFTLISFTDTDVSGFTDAAAEAGMPLEVVEIRDDRVRRLYERDLVLLRPDQHVAWRGRDIPADPRAVIDRVRGAAVKKADRTTAIA
jgi:2-polyprenyl-6-methoxyphenol hydroxylase-like FAD-dependent oxidoreductase